jgi:hypothetical protein
MPKNFQFPFATAFARYLSTEFTLLIPNRSEHNMAAMKPRTGDGPMEVTKEARSFVMRIPLEGGGRLVVELNVEEATNLGNALQAAVSLVKK